MPEASAAIAVFDTHLVHRCLPGATTSSEQPKNSDLCFILVLAIALLIGNIAVLTEGQATYSMQIRIANGHNSTGWLPFTFSRACRIVIYGEVNGEPTEILLDSGAERTIVDRRLAAHVKLRQAGSTTFSDRESVTAVPVMGGVNVNLGVLHVEGLSTVVTDLAPISAMTGLDVGLVLGREIFEKTVVDIDFASERIAFSLPEDFAPPPTASTTALKRFEAGHGRVVNVILEDRLSVSLEFDLGSANAIVLQHSFWWPVNLTKQRRISNSLIGGIGGIRETGLISLSSLTIADIRFRSVDALLESSKGPLEGRLANGVIGMPILSQFRVVTDYTRDRLHLLQQSSTPVEGLPRNRSGLRVLQEGGSLRVLLVAHHSPAEKAGWRSGERIIAVNGHPIDETYWSGGLCRWAESRSGTLVSLTLAGGSVRGLTLSDYY